MKMHVLHNNHNKKNKSSNENAVVVVVAAAVVVVVVVVVTFKVTISKGVFQLPQYSARNKPDQSSNEK